MEVSEEELQGLYTWVDEIPLSRPKRNIGRDFSDGVLLAEICAHFFPKIVELHNYSGANGTQQKMYNWNTLNQKVLKRMGFAIRKEDVVAMCNCQPGAVERVLKLLKVKISECLEKGLQGTIVEAPPKAMAPTPKQPSYQQQQQQPQPQPNVAPRNAYNSGGQQYVSNSGGGGGMPMQAHAGPPMSIQARMPNMSNMMSGAQAEEVAELRETITELKETNEILETKVRKLEQLVRLKDAKIQTLMAKLQGAGMA